MDFCKSVSTMRGKGHSGLSSLMTFAVTGLLCFLLICIDESLAVPVSSNVDKTVHYLQKYGYLEEEHVDGPSILITSDTLMNAVMEFQKFAGLEPTGVLDIATLETMDNPRCGMKDVLKVSRRFKRFAAQGSKWKNKRLTYRISKYPSQIPDKEKVDEEIAQAFKIWSDASDLKISEKKTGRATIEISFEEKKHGNCSRAFDGPGKDLAHSYFPQYGGQVHLDDEENWTFAETEGVSMLQVAAHEIGHALGLGHSYLPEALMSPINNGEYNPDFKLHQDDIAGIQMLYGASTSDLCEDARIDAIVKLQNGELYVFKDEFYWKLLLDGIAEGYPRRITDHWSGLPGNLDAAFTGPNGKTYFFKGEHYWVFNNRQIATGDYPRLIRDRFPKIPNDIDAALLMNWNRKVYIFKGHDYWRYEFDDENPVKDHYPLKISEFFPGIPMHIDAAFLAHNNRTYIFKGDKYYRYDINKVEEADPPYPRSTAEYWFKCPPVEPDTFDTGDEQNEVVIFDVDP